MALVLRFVDKNGFIQERFLILCMLKTLQHNLNVSNICGQWYNGAINIRREWMDYKHYS